MTGILKGRKDRERRLAGGIGGVWATNSQDLVHLIGKLYRHSSDEARASRDGNWSTYVYAGLPLCLAALRAFTVEYERISPLQFDPKIPDVSEPAFTARYAMTGVLADELNYLTEIRNELIHPAHTPAGTTDNWPHYLRAIKDRGLLNTTQDPSSDYVMMSQMASHRLFYWAVCVTRQLYEAVINSDPVRGERFRRVLMSWREERFPAPEVLRVSQVPK